MWLGVNIVTETNIVITDLSRYTHEMLSSVYVIIASSKNKACIQCEVTEIYRKARK